MSELNSQGDSFRALMAHFPTGVAVVSTEIDGVDFAMTVNSLTSVSLAPPLVAVCAAHTSHTAAAIKHSNGFAISLLAHDHQTIARQLARTTENPFADVSVARTPRGFAYLANGLGYMECDVVSWTEAGDHSVILARVTTLQENGGIPLVFFRSRLGTLSGLGELAEAQQLALP